MTNPKILVCLDFDHTLVDGNTDKKIRTLCDASGFPEETEEYSKNGLGFTAYMREVFKFFFKNNVTREDYMRSLSEIPLVEGMKELLLQMYESNDCEIIILSDSNSFFIQYILHHHQLSGVVTKIFTNPADFDKDGCLQIREYQDQSSCSRCARNLCKGAILESYVEKRLSEGVPFFRILYIGDGHNDVCPALRLGDNDYVFARVGYRLLRSLEKMPAKIVKTVIIPWENGYDIRNILLSS
ncbi:pyridoxal phosphate phosphatase PHOSPHO2-like [Uloborus diversus]|uniref:pyridoxal phosphate phosphatase PHOSPHO2-like n=1 Tax=Uloborus diversus TaxID=327109 RepID=UPI00240A61B7|nr:pyridoxal phosphate phosphatase PHOSPHO2-like [Uloborus diversus]